MAGSGGGSVTENARSCGGSAIEIGDGGGLHVWCDGTNLSFIPGSNLMGDEGLRIQSGFRASRGTLTHTGNWSNPILAITRQETEDNTLG
ncbi:hypothetical protein E3N88_06218 [Mikania micrantha]|uniref:Uncharacterized protein n=1 Tax=Mikania micrantha TaxID=192012 RepID=A0A5N6PP10_9ASTR|nr:hypothetical protein E3N88_06218 [Mikania micrantha]